MYENEECQIRQRAKCSRVFKMHPLFKRRGAIATRKACDDVMTIVDDDSYTDKSVYRCTNSQCRKNTGLFSHCLFNEQKFQ